MQRPLDNPKKWVGPPRAYKSAGIYQLYCLIMSGLKPKHSLLDIGCGSLRLGMYAIQYLEKNNFYGFEPYIELVNWGIHENDLKEIATIKEPRFYNRWKPLEKYVEKFDFIIAQSIFTHLSIDDCYETLRIANKIIKNNGIFLLTIKEGKERHVKKWTQETVRKSRQWLEDISSLYGFNVEKKDNYPHWNNQQWYELRK